MKVRQTSNARIVLVADDDAVTRSMLDHHLRAAGFDTILAADGQEAIDKFSADVTAALFDLQMPKRSGLECLAIARERFPDTPVMVISQFGDVRDAVEAMKQGAFEFIAKPIDSEELLARLDHAIQSSRLARENRQLRQVVSGTMPTGLFVGQSPVVRQLQEQIATIADLDMSVLITGESGTGKTTFARLIHQASTTRCTGPFVSVSCASLPRELIESELFGHVRGAFTGAVADRPGHAEIADSGTLFLDEIGDLPLELQPKLLQFLQDHRVQRIGGNSTRVVNVRVITATNQNLEAKLRDRTFREDLYFRLNVIPLSVPPLRDCVEDIPEFARFLLDRIAKKRAIEPTKLSSNAVVSLKTYHWPGNVRELENVLERASAFCKNNQITETDLGPLQPAADAHREQGTLAGRTLADIEKQAIIDTIRHCGGNKKAAARMLAIDEKTIHNKIKRYGLSDQV